MKQRCKGIVEAENSQRERAIEHRERNTRKEKRRGRRGEEEEEEERSWPTHARKLSDCIYGCWNFWNKFYF